MYLPYQISVLLDDIVVQLTYFVVRQLVDVEIRNIILVIEVLRIDIDVGFFDHFHNILK